MKIRFTDRAADEQEAIIDYLVRRSPQGAERVARSLQQTLARIVLFPLSSQVTDEPPIRRAIATPYPYAIFYEPTETEIVIYRVRHTARDPDAP